MRLISPSIKRSISPNLKILALPTGTILVVIFLFLGLIQVGYGRITSQLEEYHSAKDTQVSLNEKLNVLRQVSSSLPEADTTVIAMPDKNPGAWVVSQVRGVSQENNVTLGSLDITAAKSEDSFNKLQMSAELLLQDYASLIVLLKDLTNIAPVSTIDEVQVTGATPGGALEGTLKMTFYWSSLPTSLPAIDEAVNELTSQEQDILEKIGELEFPTFTILSPLGPTERQTPFN